METVETVGFEPTTFCLQTATKRVQRGPPEYKRPGQTCNAVTRGHPWIAQRARWTRDDTCVRFTRNPVSTVSPERAPDEFIDQFSLIHDSALAKTVSNG